MVVYYNNDSLCDVPGESKKKKKKKTQSLNEGYILKRKEILKK